MTNIEQFTRDLMLAHDIDYGTAQYRAYTFYENLAKDVPSVLNGWIGVDDKLPEIRQDVLVAGKCKTMIAHYDCCGWQYGVYEITGVTHWQPLPKPPKEK